METRGSVRIDRATPEENEESIRVGNSLLGVAQLASSPAIAINALVLALCRLMILDADGDYSTLHEQVLPSIQKVLKQNLKAMLDAYLTENGDADHGTPTRQ